MYSTRTIVISLLLFCSPALLADQAIQSPPLFGSGYLFHINNASNQTVDLKYVQFRTLENQIAATTSSTCSDQNGQFISLQPGHGCFVTLQPTFISFPVYCRVQHSGSVGDVLGSLQTYLGNDFASAGAASAVSLQPAEFIKQENEEKKKKHY